MATYKLRVVHIAGATGSGKSTAGSQIRRQKDRARKLRVWVFETDDFFKKDSETDRRTSELEDGIAAGVVSEKEYADEWHAIVKRHLTTLFKTSTSQRIDVLVLVGLLSNWSHAVERIYPIHELVSIELAIYLDPPFETKLAHLLQRKEENERCGQHGDIPEDLLEYESDCDVQRKWYEEAGYTIMETGDSVVAVVNHFIDTVAQ